MTVRQVLREQLEQALLKSPNATEAAKILGISAQTVYAWIVKYRLTEEDGTVKVRKLRARLRSTRSNISNF